MSTPNPYAAPETDSASPASSDPFAAPGHLERIGAYMIDATVALVLGVAAFMAAAIAGAFITEALITDPQLREAASMLVIVGAMSILALCWPVVDLLAAMSPLRETPGHRILGMKVVLMDGRPCPLGKRFWRALVKMLVLWLFYFLAITAVFDSARRTPWDILFGTRVVKHRT